MYLVCLLIVVVVLLVVRGHLLCLGASGVKAVPEVEASKQAIKHVVRAKDRNMLSNDSLMVDWKEVHDDG